MKVGLRRSTQIVGLAVMAYVTVLGLFYSFQRSLVFPNPASSLPPPSAVGFPEFRVVATTASDGVRTTAWYIPPPSVEAPVIIGFHGNGNTIERLAPWGRFFAQHGCGVLLSEYRGYGGNPGSPSESGLYDDGRGALDWLSRHGVPSSRVVLVGASLGTGVAVRLAAERPVAALVLMSPYDSVASVGAGRFPFLPVQALIWDRFDSVAEIPKVGASILVVHSENDFAIPAWHARRLLAAATARTEGVFLPGNSHGFSPGQAGDVVVRFLDDLGLLETTRRAALN